VRSALEVFPFSNHFPTLNHQSQGNFMATKPPPSVEQFPQDSLERLAYSVVSDIETQEPNDRNRLGYCVWTWLKDRKGTLEEAVRAAGCRTTVSHAEVMVTLRKRLAEKGVQEVDFSSATCPPHMSMKAGGSATRNPRPEIRNPSFNSPSCNPGMYILRALPLQRGETCSR
jgi:hypothetical protein